MRRLLILLLLFAAPSRAADGVEVRVSVTPEDPWVGQRTRLNLEVLAEDGWAQVSNLPDLHFEGAYVMQLQSQGTRLNEGSRTGQRYQFSVFPQRAGRIEVPALGLQVVVKRWGFPATEDTFTVRTEATSLIARTPPGAEGRADVVTSGRLESSQEWSAQPDTLQVGEAVERTVTLEAGNVSGMAFPPMPHPEIGGVGIYPDGPEVEDEASRGALEGRRIERVTYVMERPGMVDLPAWSFAWWNPHTGVLEEVRLPGFSLIVAVPPVPVEALPDERPVAAPWWGFLLAVVALAAALVAGRHRWERWRKERLASEGHAFAEAMREIRGGDPARSLGALLRWLDRLEDGERPARLDRFMERHGDERGREGLVRLEAAMASGDSGFDRGQLAADWKRARRGWKKARRERSRAERVLPELNP
jgi:hypothetical protein